TCESATRRGSTWSVASSGSRGRETWPMTEKRKRGRPRTGGLTEMARGYGARGTVESDGETVRKRVALSPTDPSVARKKRERIVQREVALPTPTASPTGTETLAQAAERILLARLVARPEWELNRMRKCI